MRGSWSQEGEDLILARLMEPRQTGFYVDVGAHHPYRFSNTAYFYLRGWRGIDIEPDPDGFAQLRRVRERDIVINCGVGAHQGQMTFHRFSEGALNTFDPALAAERERTTGHALIEKIGVEIRPLAAILSEHIRTEQRIDFMSVDAEGLDLQILQSNDWRRFRPEVVVAEIFCREIAGLDADPLAQFMGTVGYRPVAKALNSVFFSERVA